MRIVLVLLVSLCGSAQAASSRDTAARATAAYQRAEFARAAKLLERAIKELEPARLGTDDELDLRSKLVLALFRSNRLDAAVREYRALLARFTAFRFDPDRVSPSTIAFFADKAPPSDASPPPIIEPAASEPAPASTPTLASSEPSTTIVAAPQLGVDQPIDVKPAVKERSPWRWYYLAPFGVGQYLAGSPVRGTLFLVLQAGALAANIALSVLYGGTVSRDASGLVVSQDAARARSLQLGMQISFFSMLGAFAAGVLDGALEP